VAAKFVLKTGSTGKFRFNLVAANGEIITTSEAYDEDVDRLPVSCRLSRGAVIVDA
jgi:uncharacterized protein DUF1508